MWRTVRVALERDGGHRDHRKLGKPLFQAGILRFALRQTKPPAIVMDHDGDVIRVVERCRAAGERRVVEAPLSVTRVARSAC